MSMLALAVPMAAAFSASSALAPSASIRGGKPELSISRRAVAGAAIPALFLGVSAAEAAPGEIRKANQDAIGVSPVKKLDKAFENRGPDFSGKQGAKPAGGTAFGDAGREPPKLDYGYEKATSVLGKGGAIGNSGPNGFFAGGEDFKGVAVGKAKSYRGN